MQPHCHASHHHLGAPLRSHRTTITRPDVSWRPQAKVRHVNVTLEPTFSNVLLTEVSFAVEDARRHVIQLHFIS